MSKSTWNKLGHELGKYLWYLKGLFWPNQFSNLITSCVQWAQGSLSSHLLRWLSLHLGRISTAMWWWIHWWCFPWASRVCTPSWVCRDKSEIYFHCLVVCFPLILLVFFIVLCYHSMLSKLAFPASDLLREHEGKMKWSNIFCFSLSCCQLSLSGTISHFMTRCCTWVSFAPLCVFGWISKHVFLGCHTSWDWKVRVF